MNFVHLYQQLVDYTYRHAGIAGDNKDVILEVSKKHTLQFPLFYVYS